MDQNTRLFCERVVGLMLDRLNEMAPVEKKIHAAHQARKITEPQASRALGTFGSNKDPEPDPDAPKLPKGYKKAETLNQKIERGNEPGRVAAAQAAIQAARAAKKSTRPAVKSAESPIPTGSHNVGHIGHQKGKTWTSNPKKKRPGPDWLHLPKWA